LGCKFLLALILIHQILCIYWICKRASEWNGLSPNSKNMKFQTSKDVWIWFILLYVH